MSTVAGTWQLGVETLVRMREEARTALEAAARRIDRLDRAIAERAEWQDLPAPGRLEATGRLSRVQHGTDSGYYYHRRGKAEFTLDPCLPCRMAHREAGSRRTRARQARQARELRENRPMVEALADRVREAAAGQGRAA